LLFNEIERDEFIGRILAAKRALISAATLVEARIVIRSKSSDRAYFFIEEFLRSASFEIVAVDANIAEIASRAYKLRKRQRPSRAA